jgi:hypothetical protein
MKLWSEDSRLDEVIHGLGHVFMPDGPQEPKNERGFETFISNHSSAFPLDPSDPAYKKQWLEIQKARVAFQAAQEARPTIRVVCACRVHATHFGALTMSTTTPTTASAPDLAQAGNGTGVIQQTTDRSNSPSLPVRDGDTFRGFTAVDLRSGVRKLYDPDLGSANVARTPYADKNGILIALEIHCLDPRRESATEQRIA